MNGSYYDPFLTPERGRSTVARANRYAAIASEAYMRACDAGLDALHVPVDEAIYLDQDTDEEWRDEQGRTWPEHVRAQAGYRPEWLVGVADGAILQPLVSAREWWGRALRAVEGLPDPKGSYESNCRGWPGHPARCCREGSCQI